MFSQERSKTNSGIINIFEKIIRNHPLLYYIARSFVRHTNIFEEDANGVKFLKFNKAINVIDVGASDGIASKFFNQNLNVKKMIEFNIYLHYQNTKNENEFFYKKYLCINFQFQ